MEKVKLFLKGIIIGVGKIMPGVSGSMLAISLGIYENIMLSISRIFTHFKQSVSFLFNVGIGMIISIVLVSRIISFLLNSHYFPTMLLFIGLIMGGLISIIRVAKTEASNKNIILLVIPFIIFLLLDKLTGNIEFDIQLTIINALFLGMLEAITMIIPGISGTAIMMMLGVYDETLKMFSDLNFIFYLILYVIGICISAFIVSNFINKLLKSYRLSCYYLIIGFTISSIIILLKQVFSVEFTLFDFSFGIILMLVGFFISYKLE